jgi:8-oxo-dGTP pyrophosphatase MutT (NUDIX family)
MSSPPGSDASDKLCCALPYRLRADHVEILLITDRAGRWILPKGHMRPTEAPFEAAEREAWEEAGVKGSIDVLPIGGFDHAGEAGTVHILVYPLGVAEEAAAWPESDRRRRRWARAEEVARLVSRDLAPLVEEFAADTDAMLGDGADKGFDRN